MQNIYGDGNCMFRAISYILWQNEDEHRYLRSMVRFVSVYAILSGKLRKRSIVRQNKLLEIIKDCIERILENV